MKKLQKNDLWVAVITCLFLCLNLYVLTWWTPFIDEVSYSDIAINFAKDGDWLTRAWFMELGGKAFPSYPPLHFILLVPWVFLFGSSYFVCRAFGLLMIFFAFVVLYKLICKIIKTDNVLVKIGFTLLFWGTNTWMFYHIARPDYVVFFMQSLYLMSLYNYDSCDKKCHWNLIGSLVLTTLAGYQGLVYIFFYTAVFFFYKPSKTLFRHLLIDCALGVLCAFVLLTVYFALNKELVTFVVRPFAFSSSIMLIMTKVLPFLQEAGIGSQSLLNKASDYETVPYIVQLSRCYTSCMPLVYGIPVIVALLVYRHFKNICTKADVVIVLAVILFPFYMSLIGRYPVYYAWIGYVHFLLGICYLLRDVKNVMLLVIPIVIAFFGINIRLDYQKKEGFENIKTLVGRNKVSDNDVIVACYPVYYNVRQQTRSCFMYGNYPLCEENIEADYIYDWKDEVKKLEKGILKYKEYIEKQGKKLVPIDSISNPHIVLYKIK